MNKFIACVLALCFLSSFLILPENDQDAFNKLYNLPNDEFIFENPTHNFPKRIEYQLIAKDSLIAWIDGGMEQAGSRSVFKYKRTN